MFILFSWKPLCEKLQKKAAIPKKGHPQNDYYDSPYFSVKKLKIFNVGIK